MARQASFARRLVAVAVLGALLSACSSDEPVDPTQALYQQSRELSVALMDAVSAAGDPAGASTEAEPGVEPVDLVERSIAALEQATFSLTDPAAARVASDMSLVARSALEALRAGEVDRAEQMSVSQFAPLVEDLAGLVPADADGVDFGSGVPAIVILVAAAFFGFVLSRAQGRGGVPRRSATDAIAFGKRSVAPVRKTKVPPASKVEVDTDRDDPVRLRPVELKELLEAAAAQMESINGWVVPVIGPDLRVLVDPIRLERVVFAAIGAAFLRGAEHAGIVVETAGEAVIISLGDDGSPAAGRVGNATMDDLGKRARRAFGEAHASAGWHRQDGVTMFRITIPRGAQLPIELGVDPAGPA